MTRWKAWLCAATRPGKMARPGSGTTAAPGSGGPAETTTPSRKFRDAPLRTRPPLKRNSGCSALAAMRPALYLIRVKRPDARRYPGTRGSMRGMRGPLVLAMAVALAAGAQEQPPPPALDLAPLVPPEAPWLKKNQKKPGTAQKKKSKKKKQAQEPKPGAPFVASPPSSPPPLPLAEPAKPPETAKPAQAAKPAPAQPIEAQLPLPPLVPSPAPGATPAPPLLTLTSDLGVALQNDGLDAAAGAQVAEGLRGVARLAPHAKNAPLLPKPSQPCADGACWAVVAAASRVDQLLLATYAKGALKVELIDVATKKNLSSAEQAAVPSESTAATAWTEALASKR